VSRPTPPPGQPSVMLDFVDVWCPRHAEPFRAEWPSGVPVAMVEIITVAAAQPAVVQWARGDAHELEAALRRFSPLCCFLTHRQRQAIYAKAGVR
jgi:hypothetical protein